MKNLIIFILIGASFLLSGFWFGMRLAPMPKKPAPKPVAAATAPAAPREVISIDTLRQTSQNLMSVNAALQAREQSVAAREKAVGQHEEELTAERAALDQVHTHFKELYGEFQQRLQLVEDSETEQLQRQVTIFNAMDATQSADLIRALDDGTIVRLFSLMDTKPLSKLVTAWKAKYPNDAPRLLAALNGMGRVIAKDKVVLPDSPPAVDATAGASSPSPDDSAAAPDANSGTTTAPSSSPDGSTPPATPPSQYANSGTPPPDITGPNEAAANAAANPAPAPADANTPASATDANSASATPDATTPASPAAPTDATTPASPDAAPSAPAAPTPDAAPAAPSAPAPAAPAAAPTPPATVSTTPDSNSLLNMPGETAAKAANPNAPANEENDPSDSKPPPATMRLAHDKPARFAADRTN
jgi:hypothetical protein